MKLTVNNQENGGLGAAVNLYINFLMREGERPVLDSIVDKFLAAIETLPDGPLPDDTTVSLDLTDEEAALLVRVIDVVTHRSPEMENVRVQLRGGETTPEEETDEETGDLDLFDLLGGDFEEEDPDELTEVTLTVAESNMLAASNYAYAMTYASFDDKLVVQGFGLRTDEAIRALPSGAEEVTINYTEDEGEFIGRALHQMDLEGREVFAAAGDEEYAARLGATLDSVMQKFSVEAVAA